MLARTVFLFLALVASTGAFAPVSPKGMAFKKATVVKPATLSLTPNILLKMTSEEPESSKEVAPKEGTFYDDEVDPEANRKPALSDNMRARLMAEAKTGLDSDKKQTNVILYIIIAVAILVLLGGKDIFF